MTSLVEVAASFATALVEGDFYRAHELLTPELRKSMPPERLKDEFYGMFRCYADGEPTDIWYDESFAMTDWPDKVPGDLGFLYVAIHGEDFNEAVSVTVNDLNGPPLIREIIWGRP
jgi:hypothetical protein